MALNVVNQLFAAVEEGNEEQVAFLIKRHKCINARDAIGATALHHAVSNGKLRVLQALLRAGADVNATADKANVSFRTGATPLHYAARAGKVPCIRTLCRFGADVNVQDTKGATPLLMAARGGHSDAVIALLDFKGEMLPDEIGVTPLHAACGRGNAAAVHALMNAGADASAKDKYGYSPLFWAARRGRMAAVRALAESGVTLDYDDEGQTALDIALRFKHAACADLLRKLYPGAVESTRNGGGISDSSNSLNGTKGSQTSSMAGSGQGSFGEVDTSASLPSFVSADDEEQGYIDVKERPERGSGASTAAPAPSQPSTIAPVSAAGGDIGVLPRFGDVTASDEADGYIDVEETDFGFADAKYVLPEAAPKEEPSAKPQSAAEAPASSLGCAQQAGDEAYIDVESDGEAEPHAETEKTATTRKKTRRASKREQRKQEKQRKKEEKQREKEQKKQERRNSRNQKRGSRRDSSGRREETLGSTEVAGEDCALPRFNGVGVEGGTQAGKGQSKSKQAEEMTEDEEDAEVQFGFDGGYLVM